jgi:preprotein translocase subunit SecG
VLPRHPSQRLEKQPDQAVNSPLYNGQGAPHSRPPMNFAAIDWLSISINLLLVVFVIVCLLMTLIILMQRPKQEGLGAAFGGGVTDQVFGARTTNVLQRGTVYLGSLFFLLSLALAILIGHQNKKTSILDTKSPAVEEPAAAAEPAATENLPASLAEEIPAAETPAGDAAAQTEPAATIETPAADLTPAETPAPAENTTPAENARTPEEKSGEP